MNFKLMVTLGLFLSFLLQLGAQTFYTKGGHIAFYSDAPMEKIEAHNHNATSVLKTTDGRIEFAVLIKAFEFEKALMQEHFNENYMESSKFPKAVFKGNISASTPVDFNKTGEYPATVIGAMTIHGVNKEIEVTGNFKVAGKVISATSEFELTIADFGINIPGVVRDNISKKVKVTVDLNLKELKN